MQQCKEKIESVCFDIRLRKVRASGGFISFSYFFHALTPAPPFRPSSLRLTPALSA